MYKHYKKIIIAVFLIIFSTICKSQTILPFNLYFGMEKGYTRHKLEQLRYIKDKEDDSQIVYSINGKDNFSRRIVQLQFVNNKLLGIVFYEIGLEASDYSNDFLEAKKSYQKAGFKLIFENDLKNTLFMRNNDTYIKISYDIDDWNNKPYFEAHFYERSYAKISVPVFKELEGIKK